MSKLDLIQTLIDNNAAMSSAEARKLIASGSVVINGKVITQSELLQIEELKVKVGKRINFVVEKKSA